MSTVRSSATRCSRCAFGATSTADEYVQLQALVHRVGSAVSRAVPCERLYVLSLGSQQLNRHVHWHVAPLAPGVPLLRQQLMAFSLFPGEVACPDSRWEELAGGVRAELRDGDPRS